MLIQPFTVTENIVLGMEPKKGIAVDIKSARNRILDLSGRYNLKVDPDAKIEDISVGMQQRVEILKVLYNRAKIIILDEPTAVLTPQETDELFRSLRLLVHDGYTIILITHKIREVMEISDHVTVLRGGRTIRTLKTSETTPEEISELMIGRKLNAKLQRTDESSVWVGRAHWRTGRDLRQGGPLSEPEGCHCLRSWHGASGVYVGPLFYCR